MTAAALQLTRSRERLAVTALAFGAFVVTVNVNLVGALMPFLREDALYRGLAADECTIALGSLVAATNAASAIAALALGPVIDRVGRRGPMLLGGALLLLGVGAHLFAASHVELLVLRAVSGIGGGLVFASASAAVADLVPYERRAAAMGVFSAGLFLATPIGLPLGVWIANAGAGAWRSAFAWLAAPTLAALVGFARCLPHGLGRSDARVNQLAVLRAPQVAPALLAVMLYTGAFFTTVQFAGNWLDEAGLLAKEKQWSVWLALGLSTAAGSLFLPRLADRFGKRTTVLITQAGVTVCLLALAQVHSIAGVLAVGLPMTMLGALRTPALQALMSEIVGPSMRGTLMGLRAAAVAIGGSACAAAGAVVYAGHGYHALVVGAAALTLASYVLVRFGVREQR